MPFRRSEPWDESDPQVLSQIHANLDKLRSEIISGARAREPFARGIINGWHRRMLAGVPIDEPEAVGGFRGSGPPGSQLSVYNVVVGGLEGVKHTRVRQEMNSFFSRMRPQVASLDLLVPAKALPGEHEQRVLELCAYGHGELVRVHPFVQGNGRMARALVLWLAARYGLPAFLDLRPRPDPSTGYARAAASSMIGRTKLRRRC